MKTLFAGLMILLTLTACQDDESCCEAPPILWRKILGSLRWEEGNTIQVTNDGGFIIVGSINLTAHETTSDDLWLVRTDGRGDSLWTKAIGFRSNEGGYDIVQTYNGDYAAMGVTHRTDTKEDIWLVRTNAQGDTIWTGTYGGDGMQWGHGMVYTEAGEFVITGYTHFNSKGYSDMFLMKIDPTGELLWYRVYDGYGSEDYGYRVIQANDGNYVVVGRTRVSEENGFDLWIVKTTQSGDILWEKTYDAGGGENGQDIQETWDGGYIVVGSAHWLIDDAMRESITDTWLLRIDEQGDTLWTRTYDFSNHEGGIAVRQVHDEGFVIACGLTEDIYDPNTYALIMLRTDAEGDVLWSMTPGEPGDKPTSMQITSDGGYIILGNDISHDIFLLRLGSDYK